MSDKIDYFNRAPKNYTHQAHHCFIEYYRMDVSLYPTEDDRVKTIDSYRVTNTWWTVYSHVCYLKPFCGTTPFEEDLPVRRFEHTQRIERGENCGRHIPAD